ncbi:MAG: hypothetical protein G01um1014106_9 [Parcubacteria group bacterium Gr01-1014_106]|nr:MAG: hypothetical protein G01um1014106_9 [Parcubacteria group bacterium Gr01-1014_106]
MTHTPDDRFVIAELQHLLASVRHVLRPVTAADIQERIHHQRDRLQHLARRAHAAPTPLLTQPRALPRPLNPLYFARAGSDGSSRQPDDTH